MTTFGRRKVANLTQVKILERVDITSDLWLIWIEKPEGYVFKPGQYCTIGSDGLERAYSIVSSPHEERIELFVELVPFPDGVLTPKLWHLGVGNSVTIRPRAKGIFTFKEGHKNQLLVATVTGIAPYVSILRNYLNQGNTDHHFYLLDGASYADELAYRDEVEAIADKHPEILTYIPTVSRPTEDRNKNWIGQTGRVNTIVEEYAGKLDLIPEDTLVYACGHPGMIEDVKDRMIPKGFRVEEERFWKEE